MSLSDLQSTTIDSIESSNESIPVHFIEQSLPNLPSVPDPSLEDQVNPISTQNNTIEQIEAPQELLESSNDEKIKQTIVNFEESSQPLTDSFSTPTRSQTQRPDTPGMSPDDPRLDIRQPDDSESYQIEPSNDTIGQLSDEIGSVPIEALIEQEDLLVKPLEDLIDDTLKQKEYRSRAELLNDKDPKALLYWAKVISNHCIKLKSAASRKQPSSGKSNFGSSRLLALYIAFHRVAAEKFQQCASIDPAKSFAVRSTGTAPTDGWMSFNLESVGVGTSEAFPALELAFEWAMAAYRYGKALEQLHVRRTLSPPDEQRQISIDSDKANAYQQYRIALSLLMCIIEQEHRPRQFTAKALEIYPKILDHIAGITSPDKELRESCDLYLVQFSNIAMRAELPNLSIKPLVAMAKSDCSAIKECNAKEVIEHLARFFESEELGREAQLALKQLESSGKESLEERENRLNKILTADAKKRLDESGLTREEILEHIEVILSLVNWKGPPPCRLKSDYFAPGDGEKPDKEYKWIEENPKKFFTDRYKLSTDEKNPNFSILLAKRKIDKLPVAIKVIKHLEKWQKEVDREIEWSKSLRHPNLAHLLEIYRFEDTAWLVMEYCDAGNLVDLIPVAAMKEEEISYVCKQILRALNYLHRNHRMHRDLTSDNVLLTTRGDVIVADFELALERQSQRYWLSPELLSSTPIPYGPEVDIWSFGCIVMEMADGQPPYNDIHPLKEFFYTATNGAPVLHKPHKWSPEMRDFLAQCMHKDVDRRATSSQLLNHPFMLKACSREEFAQIVQYRVSWTRW